MSEFVSSDEYEGEEAWNKKISGIERELFGASSSEDEAEVVIPQRPDEQSREGKDEKKEDGLVGEEQPIRISLCMSAEELKQVLQKQEEQSQSTKQPRRRQHPAKQTKTHQHELQPEIDESTRKILEARQEFEAALIRVRAKRAAPHSVISGEGESVDFDDMVIRMKQQMMAASQADDRTSQLKQPAIAKLRLLPQVTSMLAKYTMAKKEISLLLGLVGSTLLMSFSTTTSSRRYGAGSNRWPVAFFLLRLCVFRSSVPFAWYGGQSLLC